MEKGVRAVKTLVFTHHARERMDERGVTQGQVYSALENPDDHRPSPQGQDRFVAEKRLETGQTLRVIYTEEGDFYIVITAIKIGRKRRAGR